MITHMPAAIKKTAMYLVVLSAAVIAMIYPTHDVETFQGTSKIGRCLPMIVSGKQIKIRGPRNLRRSAR